MKRRRGDGEIFSMSFLDVICCGFGAMVLLVLLAKTDAGEAIGLDAIASLLGAVVAQQQSKTDAEQRQAELIASKRALQRADGEHDAPIPDVAKVRRRLDQSRARAADLQRQAASLAQSAAPASASASDAAVKVGGIPVDSDHIIFIIDTSGSMKTDALWPRVIRELDNILSIHPQVKGFQVMNDNGVYLIKSYAGRWIPDTPGRRRSALSLMRTWSSFSNSSPVEGLQIALRAYAKRTEKLSIYIFGDDYSGNTYDAVLDTVAELNRDPRTGRPLARIHGIGFQQPGHHADRFATLMRELSRRNRGAFIALGLDHRATISEGARVNRD
ncbi:MAG: vWA domain-containing protein [bacterium]